MRSACQAGVSQPGAPRLGQTLSSTTSTSQGSHASANSLSGRTRLVTTGRGELVRCTSSAMSGCGASSPNPAPSRGTYVTYAPTCAGTSCPRDAASVGTRASSSRPRLDFHGRNRRGRLLAGRGDGLNRVALRGPPLPALRAATTNTGPARATATARAGGLMLVIYAAVGRNRQRHCGCGAEPRGQAERIGTVGIGTPLDTFRAAMPTSANNCGRCADGSST